jgi:hypothetical protein
LIPFHFLQKEFAVSDVQPESAQAQQQVPVEFDDSKAVPLYANFCRSIGTPEELVLDFGLSLQTPVGVPTHPIAITQRIIMNYYSAKRMLQALAVTIQRHEQAFGVLEIDVGRRLRPGFMSQQPQG